MINHETVGGEGQLTYSNNKGKRCWIDGAEIRHLTGVNFDFMILK